MDRRKAIKTSASILGYALSASTTAAVLNGCKADLSPDWQPRFLDDVSALIVDRITEIVIPTTETPGAKEAMVGRFIDGMLNDYAITEEQDLFREFMSSFQADCEEKFGKTFLKLENQEQSDLVQELLKDKVKGMQKIYELTVTGFCTSEIGGKEILLYDPIPGLFNGCLPLDQVGGIYSLT